MESRRLSKHLWQKLSGEYGIPYDADALVDHIVSHAAGPTVTTKLLSDLEQSIPEDDYPFLLDLIESGFHHIQADDQKIEDRRNARDFPILLKRLKALIVNNRILGSPLDLPDDVPQLINRTGLYYQCLLEQPPPAKNRPPRQGTRHLIHSLLRVLQRYMTKEKALTYISEIFFCVYGDAEKGKGTLKKRWLSEGGT